MQNKILNSDRVQIQFEITLFLMKMAPETQSSYVWQKILKSGIFSDFATRQLILPQNSIFSSILIFYICLKIQLLIQTKFPQVSFFHEPISFPDLFIYFFFFDSKKVG